jgi:hypothetical protein
MPWDHCHHHTLGWSRDPDRAAITISVPQTSW